MYLTSGNDRGFEQLMQDKPGFDHYDSDEACRRTAAPAAFIDLTGNINFASTRNVHRGTARSSVTIHQSDQCHIQAKMV